MFFALFLNIVFVKGIVDLTLGRQASWKYIAQPATPARVNES
jgi:hypothetical protein